MCVHTVSEDTQEDRTIFPAVAATMRFSHDFCLFLLRETVLERGKASNVLFLCYTPRRTRSIKEDTKEGNNWVWIWFARNADINLTPKSFHAGLFGSQCCKNIPYVRNMAIIDKICYHKLFY